jgi:CrcB protein
VYRTLLVALGGAVGSVARYLLAGWFQAMIGSRLPAGTLLVNLIGSFVLGLVMALSLDRGAINPEVRILLGAGFCGGFTTMSAFGYETVALVQYGSITTAFAYIAWTLVTCIGAAWAGLVVGRIL